MSALASTIMRDASVILQDLDNVRWPLTELCAWLNEGQAACALAKPATTSKTVTLALVEGVLQKLTDPAHLSLIRIVRNLPKGVVITPVNRDQLDLSEPNWTNPDFVPFRSSIRQFVVDSDANTVGPLKEWYCYPGAKPGIEVEAVISMVPADVVPIGPADVIASYDLPIALQEPYRVPLLDFICYRCYSKDDIGADPGRGAFHYQQYAQALGLKANAERSSSPATRSDLSKP
jgi:hypothetical protein